MKILSDDCLDLFIYIIYCVSILSLSLTHTYIHTHKQTHIHTLTHTLGTNCESADTGTRQILLVGDWFKSKLGARRDSAARVKIFRFPNTTINLVSRPRP